MTVAQSPGLRISTAGGTEDFFNVSLDVSRETL